MVTRAEWESCLIGADSAPKDGGRVAYAVKFSADGSTVALAAARAVEGLPCHVELLRCEPTSTGTAWLADWLAERPKRACCVAVDGLSGAGVLCDRLAGRVPRSYVVRPRASDAIDAASMLLDAIREKQMTHIESPALDASALSATRRPIGKNGGWGWGGADSCAVEAASLALWATRTCRRNPDRKGGAA